MPSHPQSGIFVYAASTWTSLSISNIPPLAPTPICRAGDAQGRFFETCILDRASEATRFIVDRPAAIAVKAHRAIAVVRVRLGRMRTIDRQAFSLHAEPITMRVGVRQEARLQHLVRAERNARNNVGGRKSGLLNLGVIVFRVAVEFEDAHLNQRIIPVRPDLR
jgi:hypothetical protein